MTKIRDYLVLDHIYVGFNKEDFGDLKKIFANVPGSSFSKVKAKGSSWQGIYPHTNVGSYFEMILNEDFEYGLGIAFSGAKPQYVDVRLIKKELPKIKWSTSSMVIGKKKWFDSIFVKENSVEGRAPFYGWLMHYHQRHRLPKRRLKQSAFDRLIKLSVTMDINHLKLIKSYSQWFPRKPKKVGNKWLISIPDRDHGECTVEILLKKNVPKVLINSLVMQLRPGYKIQTRKSNKFIVSQMGLQCELRRRC